MKKILSLILSIIILTTLLASCSKPKEQEKPEVLKENEITSMKSDLDIENTETSIYYKESDMSDKVVEMEDITLVSEELYRDAYYGVPVKINDKYYKIPALKILNYYFVSLDSINSFSNIDISITEETITITSPETVTFDLSTLTEGSVPAEAINIDDVYLLADEEKLVVKYKEKNYISLITLEEYMKGEKLYVDRTIGAITNNKPSINHPEVNANGLLRKNISINDEKELIVREGSTGKMLVVYDIYGSSLDITPDNISFATDLQNIFLHKTDETIYMFGLLGSYIEVYKIDIDESLNISITSVGGIQRAAQNIYYINDTYIAVGRKDVFGINIGEDEINEINLKSVINLKETGGDFNIINNEYYLSVKDQFGKITIYKFNFEEFKLEKIKELEIPISIDEAKDNFYYSFVEDNKISIYLMDNVGYIYNVLYNIETEEITTYQTDNFRLFYNEERFPIEFAINLVKANQTGDSELSLIVNNKYLGNNIIVYGIEDNWVYCSEYVEKNGVYSIYSFRYNAITGIRDYANLA